MKTAFIRRVSFGIGNIFRAVDDVLMDLSLYVVSGLMQGFYYEVDREEEEEEVLNTDDISTTSR